jgi:acyl carrier protein
MSKVKDEIRNYVKKEYLEEDEDKEIKDDTALISSGIVDSFSMVSLKMYLEKKFKISIPDAKATPQAFDTINNIIELLKGFVSADKLE